MPPARMFTTLINSALRRGRAPRHTPTPPAQRMHPSTRARAPLVTSMPTPARDDSSLCLPARRKLSLAQSLVEEMAEAKHTVHASLRSKVQAAVDSFVSRDEERAY